MYRRSPYIYAKATVIRNYCIYIHGERGGERERERAGYRCSHTRLVQVLPGHPPADLESVCVHVWIHTYPTGYVDMSTYLHVDISRCPHIPTCNDVHVTVYVDNSFTH